MWVTRPEERLYLYLFDSHNSGNVKSLIIVVLSYSEDNDCDSDPCENAGECSDTLNGYRCFCRDGYSGINCERGEIYIYKYILHDQALSRMAILVNVNISSNQSFSLMNIFMYGLWTEPFSFISEGEILHFNQIAIKYTVVLKYF